MFSCEISEIFKNTFFYRTSPVAALANRDATSSYKSLVDVWTWAKALSGYFGGCVCMLMSLFSVENNVIENMEKKINQPDEHAFYEHAFFFFFFFFF